MKSILAALLAFGVGAACLALAAESSPRGASAQQGSGYVADQRGQPVRSGFGQCWRTGYWTPAMATQECDPDLVPAKPAPVAAAPAVTPPPPRVVPPPPKPAAPPAPVREKLTFAADSLFDFDKAVVRPDGAARLDELAARTKGAELDSIVITGHTDRIGSDAYNLKLSQRRADAVKMYLISKGISADRIQAEGKGKTQPKTGPGQCKGPKSRKVIACLQPDRRVEVEVAASRTR